MDSAFAIQHVLTFVLVATRVATLVAIAPIFGPASVPLRVRGLVALALSLLIAPLEFAHSSPHPANLFDFLVLIGSEALVGLTLGLGILILFSSMQVAGQIISQMSGLQLADAYDPGFDASVPVLSQLMFYVALAVFVIIGGHRLVMEALLDTFVWLPAGHVSASPGVLAAMTSLLAESFILGIRAAAPVMVALLLATLIVGLVGRTLPQLNVMALGFSVGALVMIVTLSVSLGAAAWIFQAQVDPVLQTVMAALNPQ